MIISFTEVQTYKRCRRKWALQSQNGANLTPIKVAPALVLGGLVHKALEHWSNEPTIDLAETFVKVAAAHMDKVKADYQDKHGVVISPVEMEDTLDLVGMGHAMMTNYLNHYTKPFPKQWTLINVEQRLTCPIPGTEHFECDACHNCWTAEQMDAEPAEIIDPCNYCNAGTVTWQPHMFRGTLDGLLRNSLTGLLYILERKTYGRHPNENTLRMDEQMRTYLWLLAQVMGWPEVGGVLYDGMWKRDGSVKSHKDQLFYREVFTRSRADIEECGEHLAVLATEMSALVGLPIDDPKLYTNRRWEGCFDCGMAALCEAISKRGDVEGITNSQYTQRTDDETEWTTSDD